MDAIEVVAGLWKTMGVVVMTQSFPRKWYIGQHSFALISVENTI